MDLTPEPRLLSPGEGSAYEASLPPTRAVVCSLSFDHHKLPEQFVTIQLLKEAGVNPSPPNSKTHPNSAIAATIVPAERTMVPAGYQALGQHCTGTASLGPRGNPKW